MTQKIPHLRVVISVTAYVMLGFSAVSIYALLFSEDEVTKGNIIGTWQNFALLAVGFWIGSSSGGKMPPGVQATGKATDPVHIAPEVDNPDAVR